MAYTIHNYLEDILDYDEVYTDDNDYGADDPPTQVERDAADEAFDNMVKERGY